MLKKYLIPHRENDYKPHLFREFSILVFLALTLLVFAGSLFVPQFIKKNSLTAEIYESVLISLANQDRSVNQLSTLTLNPLLAKAAKAKADDMAAKSYFAHQSPDGRLPWDFIAMAGYSYLYAGENLAIDFTDSSDVENAWMNSPKHRENILGNHFTEIGIGVSKGVINGRETTFVVQMFGSPKLQTVAQNVPAASVPTKQVKLASGPKMETVSSTPTFIEVKTVAGESVAPESSANSVPVIGQTKSEVPKNWLERTIGNPAHSARIIYTFLAILISLGLLLFIFIEWRVQHPKNIAYGVLILVILISAIYINLMIFLPTVGIV